MTNNFAAALPGATTDPQPLIEAYLPPRTQRNGVALIISRRKGMTCSFNYLYRVASFENNFWVGYVTRTVRESVTGTRVARMVYEHLGDDLKKVLPAARSTGFRAAEDLMPFHRRLLQVDDAFR